MKSIFTIKSKTILLFFTLFFSTHTLTAATLTALVNNNISRKTLSSDSIKVKETSLLLSSAANNLSITEYQRLSGKKLSLKNKIRYLFIKHELKPKSKHESMLPSVEGFILGLFLGPIGVLIAYIFSKNKKLRHAAIAGGIINILLFFLAIVLIAAALKNIAFNFVISM